MFLPSVNNLGSGVYRCQMCCELIIDGGFNAALICDDCNAKIEASKRIESGCMSNNWLIPNDNLLLDTYYKRDIKISFSNHGVYYGMYYTVMMIPNKDNWLDEKIKESEAEMKKAGLKKISFKILSHFTEMTEWEISYFMNSGTSSIRVSYNTFSMIHLPLVLKQYANAKGSGKDWSEFGWKLLNVFILLISVFITLSCILLFIFSIYSHAWVGALFLPLSILSGVSTYEAFETLKD